MAKICIRSIQYYEMPVKEVGVGYAGNIQSSIPTAEVELYKEGSFDVINLQIDIRDFPHWEDLREYITQRAVEFLKNV